VGEQPVICIDNPYQWLVDWQPGLDMIDIEKQIAYWRDSSLMLAPKPTLAKAKQEIILAMEFLQWLIKQF
jgi:hypothetical protein